MEGRIAIDWRLKGARYRLEGVKCAHCGALSFPPRAICSECGGPVEGPRQETAEEAYYVLCMPQQEALVEG